MQGDKKLDESNLPPNRELTYKKNGQWVAVAQLIKIFQTMCHNNRKQNPLPSVPREENKSGMHIGFNCRWPVAAEKNFSLKNHAYPISNKGTQ